MFRGLYHLVSFLTTGSSARVLVAFHLAGSASELFAIVMLTSGFRVVVASIETALELHRTTFSDCGNIPSKSSSMKTVPRRMFTAS